MSYTEWKDKYKHTPYVLKPNKKKIPLNTLYFDNDVKEFNKIYEYCKKNYLRVESTQSKGISVKIQYKYHERYMVNKSNQCFELVIVCAEGCYRFMIKNRPNKSNTIQGTKAAREIYKQADKYGVAHIFESAMSEDGDSIKKDIKSPHIQFMLKESYLGQVWSDCYHLDLHSAYASQLVNVYPELRPMYEDIYNNRKQDDGYFKHVLTNSIGCFQSEYCPIPNDRQHVKPYILASLAKIAVNGTREIIEDKLTKLKNKGFLPILTNTDGIWYSSPTGRPYHDEDEGEGLGKWSNDHKRCKLLVKSTGAYQFVENNKCTSVVRGTTKLDDIKPREEWQFGEIMQYDILEVEVWKFDESKGVIKKWQTM